MSALIRRLAFAARRPNSIPEMKTVANPMRPSTGSAVVMRWPRSGCDG